MKQRLVCVVAALALAVAACSSAVDRADIESELSTEIEAQSGVAAEVSCDDDLAAEVGAEIECSVTFDDGTSGVATVVATAVDGDNVSYEWSVADA